LLTGSPALPLNFLINNQKLMDFSKALTELKMGAKMTRKGWNGKDMWVALQIPTPSSKMGAPYLYMSMVDGTFVPWLAAQTDLMANDWDIASPNGGVNCACDMREKCDDPVGDKILHDILKNGCKCEYAGKEENIVDKFEQQIAFMIVDGIKREYPGQSFGVQVDVKIDKK